jgi:NADH dehydrogenase FAD-containing subunit
VAAEMKIHFPTRRVILIHSRAELLSAEPLPKEFQQETLRYLNEMNVEVLLGKRVLDVQSSTGASKEIRLSTGEVMIVGHVLNTTLGHVPNTEYLPREATTEKGFVKVLPT